MSQVDSNVATISAVPQQATGVTVEKRPTLVIVEPNAWNYYKQFRQYLRSDYLGVLVAKRPEMKPLTLEEVSYLVRPEYDPADHEVREMCHLCGEEFTPVRWMDISNEQFLDLVGQGASIQDAAREAQILIFGPYYLNQDLDAGYGAFCGRPYYFNPKLEKFGVNARSCIGMAKENHPKKYWGTDQGEVLDQLQQIEAEQRQVAEEVARRKQGAADFFGGGCRPRKNK